MKFTKIFAIASTALWLPVMGCESADEATSDEASARAGARHARTVELLTPEETATLIGARSQAFGGMQLRDSVPGYVLSGNPQDFSVGAVNGSAQPIFELNADDQIIIHWNVPDSMASAFAAALALPASMQLTPIAPLENDELGYTITLNVFKSSGLSTGNKAEWKTYVTVGGDPTPRALVFDKQSSEAGIDPIEVLSIPTGPVDWSISNGVATGLIVDQANYLSITVPQVNLQPRSQDIEVLSAADTTYSLMSTPVKMYYNSSVARGKVNATDVNVAQITGNMPWLAFTGEVKSILFPPSGKMLTQPLASVYMPADFFQETAYGSFVMNILGSFQPGSPNPPITPEQGFPMLMQQFGPNPTLVFGLMSFYNALGVMQGQVPLLSFKTAANPKPLFINYLIPKKNVKAFEAAFVPAGYKLSKIKFVHQQKNPEYAISLNIYKLEGNSAETSGYRAEWSTYVKKDGDPHPRFMILKAVSTAPGLDPVYAAAHYDPSNFMSIFSPPAVVQYTSDSGALSVTVGTLNAGCVIDPTSCVMEELLAYAMIQIPANAVPASPTAAWMAANDSMFWTNGVADLAYFDATVNDAELLVFKPKNTDVLVDSNFAGFVEPTPMSIILFGSGQNFALKAWGNI
ncbi:MAG: hypothetical protein MUC50_14175 [Myxococcota bacterium]|jgi:hypothetical protein|nr:hypothetical protein [Myxococcota bacterium]